MFRWRLNVVSVAVPLVGGPHALRSERHVPLAQRVYVGGRLTVCILSAAEAGRLEHYGDWPQCVNHQHMSGRLAAAAAKAGMVRFLGGPGTKVASPVSMVVRVRTRQWQPVPTAGLLGLRTWGNARSS